MKQGFALSINTLVVLILGIVLLGGGFLVIQMITEDAAMIVEGVDSATQSRVNDLLSQGELLAIPNNNRDGGFEQHVFALGFSNRFPDEREFIPRVLPIEVVSREGTVEEWNSDVSNSNIPLAAMLDYVSDPIRLKASERKLTIPVSIWIRDGVRGTYTYRATIHYVTASDTEELYAEKLIRINVI